MGRDARGVKSVPEEVIHSIPDIKPRAPPGPGVPEVTRVVARYYPLAAQAGYLRLLASALPLE